LQQGRDVLKDTEGLLTFYIQMSPNLIMTERRVYNILDWMKEAGGFYGFLLAVSKLILPFFQVWSLEKFLIKKLYSYKSNARKKNEKVNKEQQPIDKALFHLRYRKKIRPSQDCMLITMCKLVMCRLCKPAGADDKKRLYEKAKHNLEQELDVVHFIKMSRLLHNSVKLLFTPRERQIMDMQAYRQVVSDNSSSGKEDHYTQRNADSKKDYLTQLEKIADNKEDYFSHLEKLKDDSQNPNSQFNEREVLLLKGVLTRHE
jgi:hypothetical protein